jgi:hypothetical protein
VRDEQYIQNFSQEELREDVDVKSWNKYDNIKTVTKYRARVYMNRILLHRTREAIV